jgi:hypothetical protein
MVDASANVLLVVVFVLGCEAAAVKLCKLPS